MRVVPERAGVSGLEFEKQESEEKMAEKAKKAKKKKKNVKSITKEEKAARKAKTEAAIKSSPTCNQPTTIGQSAKLVAENPHEHYKRQLSIPG